MTVQEAATALGVSVETVYALCARKRLEHYRLGPRNGKIDITAEAIERYRLSCLVPVETPEDQPTTTVKKTRQTNWQVRAQRFF